MYRLVKSSKLGQIIAIVPHDGEHVERAERILKGQYVVYSQREADCLKGMAVEDICVVHEAKKAFKGIIVEVLSGTPPE